jgi:hypothetical protein
MATELEIANAAVAEVGGHETILDLNESSAEAKVVKPALARAIKYIASKWDWPVARKRELQVADVTFSGDSRYGFRFSSKANGTWRYETEDGSILTDFAIENGYVYTNVENTYFRYTDVETTDVTTWPEVLTRVLEYYLAARIAVPLSAGEGTRQEMDALWRQELKDAKSQFSRQGPPQTYMSDAQSQFIEAHQGNGII